MRSSPAPPPGAKPSACGFAPEKEEQHLRSIWRRFAASNDPCSRFDVRFTRRTPVLRPRPGQSPAHADLPRKRKNSTFGRFGAALRRQMILVLVLTSVLQDALQFCVPARGKAQRMRVCPGKGRTAPSVDLAVLAPPNDPWCCSDVVVRLFITDLVNRRWAACSLKNRKPDHTIKNTSFGSIAAEGGVSWVIPFRSYIQIAHPDCRQILLHSFQLLQIVL